MSGVCTVCMSVFVTMCIHVCICMHECECDVSLVGLPLVVEKCADLRLHRTVCVPIQVSYNVFYGSIC